MRFHHSTRRRPNPRHGAGNQSGRMGGAGLGQAHSLSSRWAQLTYCRQTNIHFNRRLPVEPPLKFLQIRKDLGQPQPQQIQSRQDSLDLNYNKQQDFNLINDNYQLEPRPLDQPDEQHQQQQQHHKDHQSNVATSSEPIDEQLNRLHLNHNNQRAESNSSTRRMSPSINQTNVRPAMSPPSSSSSSKQRKLLPTDQRQQRSNSQKSTTSSSNTQESSSLERDEPTNKNNNSKLELQQAASTGGAGADDHDHDHDHDHDERLDMELVREKLVAQVEKHPFWSNKAAKRMRLVQVNERRVFIYELVSYCERRELEWRYEPYKGGLVAGSTPYRRQQVASGEAVATNQLLVGADQANSINQLSASQPTSPSSPNIDSMLGASTALARQQLVDLNSSMLQQNQTTLQVPIPTTTPAQQHHHHHHHFEFNSTTTPTTPTRQDVHGGHLKSPIRRSCSSAAAAAASPAGNATTSPLTYYSHQQTSNGSLLTVDTTTTMSAATQEPRPLPSAELVWSVAVPAHLQPAPFVAYVHTVELPGSSFVKRCHGCQGRGRLKCASCHGVGYEVCISCSGKGTMKSLSRNYGSSVGGSAAGANSRHSTGRSDYHEHSSGSSSHQQYGGMWGDSSSASSESRRQHSDGEPGGITQSAGGSGAAWISESCHFCHGAGQKRCWICAGRAYNCCLACAGTGQLRCYLKLNISWINHKDECIVNNADSIIPKERLKLSSGALLVDEAADQLSPTSSLHLLTSREMSTKRVLANTTDGATADHHHHHHHHHQRQRQQQQQQQQQTNHNKLTTRPTKRSPTRSQLINEQEANQLRLISARMLEKHLASFKQERLIRQRQRVTQVDCFVVNWEWKRRRGHFVIHGDEQKVYIAKYPFKSICNIT